MYHYNFDFDLYFELDKNVYLNKFMILRKKKFIFVVLKISYLYLIIILIYFFENEYHIFNF